MPSHPVNQFADLEEMMCKASKLSGQATNASESTAIKKILNLDMRDQTRGLSPLSLAMRTPGYVRQHHNCGTISCLNNDPPADSVFLSTDQWGQKPESHLPCQLSKPTKWVKQGFLSKRSISMIETSSPTAVAAASLVWSGTDPKNTLSEISPTSVNSMASSTSSLSTSSSSSRYKTELCRSFTESGLCKYGGKCQFAHGPEELRDLSRHPKYKTEPCRTFHTIGFCPYGIRCHFVHNNEEEMKPFSRSSSSSTVPQSHSHRPPLLRQSFSFAGFPSVPQQGLQPIQPGQPTSASTSFTCAPSASPPPCADFTDLLSHAFLEMDSLAFEASPSPQYQLPNASDHRTSFLPSPDSGCSPTTSPSLVQSLGTSGAISGPLGTRSLSYTSLSDQDQDGSSSASSLSGSESCNGNNEGNGKRLAVFSQLSVPDDAAVASV